jgi:hypothetical protein
LTRPLKLSKCFAYKKVPRIILRPFDSVWKKRAEIELDGFTLEDYSGQTYDHRFNELFKAANNKTMIRQVRNSEFLNWRYRNVPGRNYKTIIFKKDDGKLNGYIILRLAIAYGMNVGFIMDFVNRDGSEAGKSLIRYALNYFWDNDAAVAAALCFPDCIENGLLRKQGFFVCPKRIRPNPFILCMKTFYNKQNQFDTAMMTDSRRWYFMFGDFQVF